MESLSHAYVQTNGIRLHYVIAGQGPLVILLHGFPEFWYEWRHQIPVLAKHFTVVAPDLRGYNDSDKPTKVNDYRLSVVEEDIVGLIHSLGHKKAYVVGHDWGGAVAWRLALDHPEVVEKLAILNSPHPQMFAKAMAKFEQVRKAWYMLFFQLPFLPELLIQLNLKSALRLIMQKKAKNKKAITDSDIDQYVAALRKPHAIASALNYYRAAFRNRTKESHLKGKKIEAPTLLLWGLNDPVLGKNLTEGMEPLFDSSFQVHYIENCSHWVNEEQPEEVNEALLQFLKQHTDL